MIVSDVEKALRNTAREVDRQIGELLERLYPVDEVAYVRLRPVSSRISMFMKELKSLSRIRTVRSCARVLRDPGALPRSPSSSSISDII